MERNLDRDIKWLEESGWELLDYVPLKLLALMGKDKERISLHKGIFYGGRSKFDKEMKNES